MKITQNNVEGDNHANVNGNDVELFQTKVKSKQTWKKKPTKMQLEYWKSMVGKKGKDAPAWKGFNACVQSKHQWLAKNYGKPTHCVSKNCSGKNKLYEWCLKKGREYTHNPKDYLWLCRSCHRQYDLTPKKKLQAINNLWWKNGKENPTKK